MKRSILAIFSFLAVTFLAFGLSNARGGFPLEVPEPSTLVLLGAGVAGLTVYRLIRKRKK
jgi:hypothetical protein